MAAVLLFGFGMNGCVTAAPSIEQLQSRAEAEIIPDESNDGTNTAEVIVREGIYVDRADSTEYMKEEGGVLVPTKLSEAIDAAKETQTEKISVLQMEEYDLKTGTYTVTFPGIGPFMVVQER